MTSPFIFLKSEPSISFSTQRVIYVLFDNFIINKGVYIGAVYGALLVSLFDALAAIGVNITSVQGIIGMLPFASEGFSWLVPAVVGALFGAVLFRNKISTQN